MEGMDNKWTDLGSQRTISFINLDPGKYVLRVKGSNNDGLWNEEGAAIEITITPPFWKSAVACIIYVLLILGSGLFAYRYYLRYNQRKAQQKLDRFHREKDKEMYESKINFFTHIAHEIRTPISLIKAPVESIISSEDGNDETKDKLNIVAKNIERLLDLISQLLDFRKTEEKLYQLSFTQVKINELLQEIYIRFKSTADTKKIKMNLLLPPKPVIAYMDKEALNKIVGNLLSNALKYANSLIDIRLTATEHHFEINVSDDGIGIPDEMKISIFEPFFQIENNETSKQKIGTGIGLALVKQLVERLDGEITLQNNPDKGVAFSVCLPKQEEPDRNSEEHPVSEKHTEKQKVTSEHNTVVLIVEDNEELLLFLEKEFTKEHQVLIAGDGQQAVAILEEHIVDLIISDIVMPRMNGLELAHFVKQNEQYSHIPIILLSAKNNVQTKIEGLECGIDSYIEKPFAIAYLKAQVNNLIENRIKLIEKFAKSPVISYRSIAHNKQDEAFLKKVNKDIEQHLSDGEFSLETLAITMSMSSSNLRRKIKGISGMLPNNYIRLVRLKKAAQLLQSSEYRVSEIYEVVGFSNPSYFSKCFQEQFGMLPKDFAKKTNK
jgi:signal transduction histidine kinase/DNA-binding response OmpR family regulator